MESRRRPPLRLFGLIAVVVAVGVAGWLVSRGGEAGESSSRSDPTAVTAPVERRVLEAVQVARGTVFAPAQATVVAGAPAGGELAVVVTALPVPLGAEVGPGAVAVELNGRPVLALPGEIPVYRDLRPGDVGPDVAAVQSSLLLTGQEISERERSEAVFGSSTQRAVSDLYENAGYEPSYTLGSQDAVAEAERGAADAADAAETSLELATVAGTPDTSAAQQVFDAAVAARDQVQAAEGVMLLAGEFVAVPLLPATLVEQAAGPGERVEAGAPVVTLGSSAFQVRVEVTSAQVNELDPDVVIAVFSDAGYEATCAPAPPQATGAPAEQGEGETGGDDPAGESTAAGGDAGGEPTAEGELEVSGSEGAGSEAAADGDVMDVTCDPLPPDDSLGASLRVTLTVRRSQGEVLVVPATAVTTSSSGETFVQVVDAEDDTTTRVSVTVGGEAEGFVAVTPLDDADALAEGMGVRVRQR